MKMTWKSKNIKRPLTQFPNLPFQQEEEEKEEASDILKNNNTNNKLKKKEGVLSNDVVKQQKKVFDSDDDDYDNKKVSQLYEEEGNKLAEDGKYSEALGKWETALTLTPERAVLHEQKAQILLELGEAWNAVKAATRATELEPTWTEAWITLGRAQLNFGEPDSSIESFDRALAIKPESVEARGDRQTAMHLTKRRKQLHSAGLNANENRFVVREKPDHS